MKRTTFLVTLTDVATGAEIARATRYAMNSGITASEALVRELARSENALYGRGVVQPRERNNPNSPYQCEWIRTNGAADRRVIARVAAIA